MREAVLACVEGVTNLDADFWASSPARRPQRASRAASCGPTGASGASCAVSSTLATRSVATSLRSRRTGRRPPTSSSTATTWCSTTARAIRTRKSTLRMTSNTSLKSKSACAGWNVSSPMKSATTPTCGWQSVPSCSADHLDGGSTKRSSGKCCGVSVAPYRLRRPRSRRCARKAGLPPPASPLDHAQHCRGDVGPRPLRGLGRGMSPTFALRAR